jgi:ubiquinol-cytochrome c reductase cytochrome c1 subunit
MGQAVLPPVIPILKLKLTPHRYKWSTIKTRKLVYNPPVGGAKSPFKK